MPNPRKQETQTTSDQTNEMGFYMYAKHTIPVLIVWQQLLEQAQSLAARLPDTGINPDKLAVLPLDDLVGTLAYLKRLKAEREA